MSKTKNKTKNKGKKSKRKGGCVATLLNRDMADFITDRIGIDLEEDRDILEDICSRIREGDASPNEIDSAIQDAVESINSIIDAAKSIEAEVGEERFVAVGE
jgi:3-hydroxyacyl-CoA dehydrogenase